MKYKYITSLSALIISSAANSAVVNLVCNVESIGTPGMTITWNVSFSPDKKTFSLNSKKLDSVSVDASHVSGKETKSAQPDVTYNIDRITGEFSVKDKDYTVLIHGPCVPAGKSKF